MPSLAIIARLRGRWDAGLYGKVWFVTSAVMCLVGFIGMIVIASNSTKTGSTTSGSLDHPYRDLWVENATEIYFPDFQFDFTKYAGVDDGAYDNNITDVKCVQWGFPNDPIAVENCDGKLPEKCRTVRASSARPAKYYSQDRILCNISSVHPAGAQYNTNLGWKFAPSSFNSWWYGPWVGYMEDGEWIAPTKSAYVLLQQDDDLDDKGRAQAIWNHKLVYHDPLTPQGDTDTTAFYGVGVLMSSMRVNHYKLRKTSDTVLGISLGGIQATGTIGGFWYFLYIIHLIFMSIVEIFLPNPTREQYKEVL